MIKLCVEVISLNKKQKNADRISDFCGFTLFFYTQQKMIKQHLPNEWLDYHSNSTLLMATA